MNLPGSVDRSEAVPIHTLGHRAGIAAETPHVRPGRALILAEGFRLQYRVLRCAAAFFEGVIVLGAHDARPLRLSSSCLRFVPLARDRFEDEDVRVIEDVCERFGIGCVLPSCSVTTRFLALHRERITASCFPGPTTDIFDRLDHKGRFAALCLELGVPHPPTRCFATFDDLMAAARDGSMPSPLVLKPPAMWGSRGVCKIAALDDIKRGGAIDYEPILTQPFIPGRDVSAFFCCSRGHVDASVAYVKTSSTLQFLRHDEIEMYASRIIRHLDYSGVLGFDIRERADGSISFIECNPRFWYNIDAVMVAGVNFIAVACGGYPSGMAPGVETETIMRPWAIVRNLMTSWRLTHVDRAMLLHLASDPLPLVFMALQRMCGSYRIATGRQL